MTTPVLPTIDRTPAGDPIYRTTAPLSLLGYVVPAGFITDLASTPKSVQDRLPPNGPWADAAILHDWLYVTNRVPRYLADLLFLRAMKLSGVPVKARLAMYAAVVIFGGNAYRQKLGWKPAVTGNPHAQ